jgi:5-methylcytosine-specific restriction endonuclease McrA
VAFYDSDEWRNIRYQALKIHGGACQCCGNRASADKPLHVDHIKPRSKFPELELDLNNLQVLCKDCNLGKRAWDQTDWRPVAEAAE